MEEHRRTLLAAQGYCELRMYEEALAELSSLPAEVHHHPVTVEMRLVTLMQAKRWPEALESGRELCTLVPNATSPFIHTAFCLHEMGQTMDARDVLLQGPEALRQEANYYYNLACYECVLGHVEEARQLLEKSITMDARYREFAKTDEDLRGLQL